MYGTHESSCVAAVAEERAYLREPVSPTPLSRRLSPVSGYD